MLTYYESINMPLASYIGLNHIHLFRGGRHILKDFSLSIMQGDAILLTGPNGVGKSSLLRAIAGLCPIESGEIIFQNPSLQDDIAWLGAQDALKPSLTLEENLSFSARLGKKNMDVILKHLALSHLINYPTRLLSSGQKRRAAFARVYLSDAKIWLLDEPINGIDQETITIMGEIIAQHRQNGGTIIAASHIPIPLKKQRIIALKPHSSPFNLYHHSP